MTTATRKLTAEEGKPNNRNNGWKYEHETMKCYETENNWRNKNNKYAQTNWKMENNGQKTRKQNKVEAPWLHTHPNEPIKLIVH